MRGTFPEEAAHILFQLVYISAVWDPNPYPMASLPEAELFSRLLIKSLTTGGSDKGRFVSALGKMVV